MWTQQCSCCKQRKLDYFTLTDRGWWCSACVQPYPAASR